MGCCTMQTVTQDNLARPPVVQRGALVSCTTLLRHRKLDKALLQTAADIENTRAIRGAVIGRVIYRRIYERARQR